MKPRLNYFWRLFATGFCFTVFGLGGLLLSMTVFPLINVWYRDRQLRKDHTQRAVQLSFKLFIRLMESLGIMNLEIQEADRLQQLQNHILVANHPSLIDVVAVISFIPKIDCIVKKELWSNPFLRGVVEAAGYISNSDPEKLVDSCVQSVEQGNSLLVFPEGSRSLPGKPLKFKRGAAITAIQSGKPIIPIVIKVEPTTLTKAEHWYQIPKRPFCCKIAVGKKFEIQQLIAEARTVNSAARKVTEALENYFCGQLKRI